MSGYWRHLRLCCIALLVAAPLIAAEDDPPGRVGRVSLANEGVELRVGDSLASGRETLNWPLTTGARLNTASGARSEARIGSITLHLDGETSLEFVELSDERIWLRLNRGSILLWIQNPEQAADMALDTPEGRLRLDAPGSYRADVAGGTTAFSVYSGAARIEDRGLAIRPGDRVLLLGGVERNYLLGLAGNDDFRQWALAREQSNARGGNRYVSPDMTGYEELERYGRWQDTSEFGPVWFPQGMPAGWAPYRWGHWVWVAPWGWTWIDQSPWGFAPFHYGRWALIGGNWAWLPGAYTARPVYAPALVAWLGQPGWTVSFSFGSAPAVGWFPLGPREIYYPHYRSSLRHVRNVNAHHVPNAPRIVTVTPPRDGPRHIHRDRHEAVTIVPEKTVLSGSPVHRTVAVEDNKARSAAPITSSPTVVREHKPVQATPPARPIPVPPGAVPMAPVPQKVAPPARNAAPLPKNQPKPLPNEGSAFPHSRDTVAPRHDKPASPPQSPWPTTTFKEPMRQPAPSAEPRRMPPQAPDVIIPVPRRQMPAAEGGRDEAARVPRVLREPGSGKVTESGNRERKHPKQGPQER